MLGDYDLAFHEMEMQNTSNDKFEYFDFEDNEGLYEAKSHHHEHHKKHHHKHHHRHHHDDSESEKLDSKEIELRKIQFEKKAEEFIKKCIEENDTVRLSKIFDLGISVNSHDFLLFASKQQNVSISIVEFLIKEGVSLDSNEIGESDIMRNFIFNGRDDLLKLVHEEYDLNFEEDESSKTIVRDLASMKILKFKRIDILDTLYDLGFKFPPSEEGMKFSSMLKLSDFDKEVIDHAKKLEKKAGVGKPWYKKLFKNCA